MQDAEGGSPRKPDPCKLNPVTEKHIALRSLLTCCVLASLESPPGIYLCMDVLMETLDVAPKGCSTPARAALALQEDTAGVCGRDAAVISGFGCRISPSIQATRYDKTPSPGSAVPSGQYII